MVAAGECEPCVIRNRVAKYEVSDSGTMTKTSLATGRCAKGNRQGRVLGHLVRYIRDACSLKSQGLNNIYILMHVARYNVPK